MIKLPRPAKPTLLAIACILPIMLLLYEYLASQNGHLSLLEPFKSLPINESKITESKTLLSSKSSAQPLQKLSIKTKPDMSETTTDEQLKEPITEAQQAQTNQTVIDTSSNQTRVKSLLAIDELPKTTNNNRKAVTTKGEHTDGKLHLPALKVDAHWSNELIMALLREGKIRVVASNAKGQHFDYKMNGTAFHQGTFVPLKDYDLLSDRRLLLRPLSGAAYHQLLTAYKLSVRGTHTPNLMIRFTRQFNHEISQQQLALVDSKTSRNTALGQASNASELGTTVLSFSTSNGESRYTMSAQ